LVEVLAQIVTRLGLSEIEVANGDSKSASRGSFPLHCPAGRCRAAGNRGERRGAGSGRCPGTVKSPMVETAYLRASPDSAPFVEIGAQVKAGDKFFLSSDETFNEILAPRAGTVTGSSRGRSAGRICQPLLVIE